MIKSIRKAREDGFTLIELLIVIIVLGILVAIVLFGLGTFKGDSQAAACKADLKQLRTAATAWIAGHPGTAASVTQLTASGYLQAGPDVNADGVTLAVTVATDGTYTVTKNGNAVPAASTSC